MTTRSNRRECSVSCRSFKCSRKALLIKRIKGQKQFICKLDGGECIGYMCNFAECAERKLADDGTCLKVFKPKIAPKNKPKRTIYDKYDYMTTNDLDDKLLKKLNKKIR